MKVKLKQSLELTQIKYGSEYPKTFRSGDIVDVDDWSAKSLCESGLAELAGEESTNAPQP